MKKVVFKLNLPDNKAKQKAMKDLSALPGIDSITVDMKSKTLTIIGVADPVEVVTKFRKSWSPEIISVGPAKGPDPDQKKEEPKKEEPKKEEPKQEEPKKEEPKKKEEKKKEPKKEEKKKNEPTQNEQIAEVAKAYKAYNPQMTYYYDHRRKANPPNYF